MAAKPNSDAPRHPQPDEPEAEKLSRLLARLAEGLAERPMNLEELVCVTQGRAYDVLLILLSLPFVTPVPLPFLSTALGSVMVLIGVRLSLGQRPWLPKRILQHRVEGRHLVRLLNASSRVLSLLELLLRPRLHFVHTTWVFQRITGALIVISGFLLLLPLPIPFSNILPALTVLVLAAGALERDGLFFFAGCALFAVNLVFFSAIFVGGFEAISWLVRWLGWPAWGDQVD